MYVNPFWAGVVATLLIECILIGALIVVCVFKEIKKK